MNKIELRNLTKAYGKNPPVLEGLDLTVREGSFTVLLGPSGCGKSTILRIIAGLEKETAGEVAIDGASVKDVEPGDRNIAMVFQNYALYPTMTVRGNIEFGLKNMKVPREDREERIAEIARMVGLEGFLDRKPQQLSGGQRQRVALARAIVKKPSVFLMDEPLSNLDAKLRSQIRTDLIQLYHQLGATFVYVTHDQVEAMSMGTDIILLEEGKIQQAGSPEEIYARPANMFTARFIGSPPMNLLEEKAFAQTGLRLPQGTRYVGFRPEKALVGGGEDRDNAVQIEGRLLAREMLGDQILYKMQTPFGVVHAKSFDTSAPEYALNAVAVPMACLYCYDERQLLIS